MSPKVMSKNTTPGPGAYDTSMFTKKKNERAAFGNASRDIPFSKYKALNVEFINKGI